MHGIPIKTFPEKLEILGPKNSLKNKSSWVTDNFGKEEQKLIFAVLHITIEAQRKQCGPWPEQHRGADETVSRGI